LEIDVNTVNLVQGGLCLIGDLQATVGLEPKTIRFYEDAGMVKPRRIGRIRVYDHDDARRLKVVKFLRQFDLSLQLIRTLLKKHASIDVNNIPEEARDAITKKLQERREELARLEKLL
jgi:DNA-binding transcriptional MerR regulator